ncbi:C40 family peptidase [Streptomyces sp. Da 82-17]|uniref:C40 family peptidase n=1 Tax=Streptomyces sp. Da 82-17 TaxID=3377116 RepID=UPI0038D35E41
MTLAPVFLISSAVVVLAGTNGAEAACARGGDGQRVDASAVARQVRSVLEGREKGRDSVPGLDAPKAQVSNAEKILATGVAMMVPARGQVVALATALQESGLRNLAHGDRDSLGLFQQRPSQGWGSADQVRDPVYASRKFYERLLQVPGWESMTVTQAAQAVQQSGFPDAYAKWEPLAGALQRSLASSLSEEEGREEQLPVGPLAECGPGADGASYGPIPDGSVPKAYKIPASAPKSVRKVIRWGLSQLGTPYQWGGRCTDPRGQDPMGRCDCSSLMQAMFKAGGVSLSRTTYTQVKEGKAVSVDALKPGDLLFTRGTAQAPEHVGMFIGDGLILHAPRTGDVVKISTLAEWRPDILATRRVV